jgi:hypothetical protein
MAADADLVDAVCQDVTDAFARFTKDCPGKSIVGLALCSVDDASPPYIMGAALEDEDRRIGPISLPVEDEIDSWQADPADWAWNDEGNQYRCEEFIGAILDDEDQPFDERAKRIFEGIVAGLQKFDASGKFKGKLPREQMLLVLWIMDPSDKNAKSVMKWAKQTNPKPVSDWFNQVYSYR